MAKFIAFIVLAILFAMAMAAAIADIRHTGWFAVFMVLAVACLAFMAIIINA